MTLAADPDEVEYRARLQRALGADFELRELIGRGGFGAVYVAWDRRLDREVAVKALRHDVFPTRLVLERFEREAKAVAKLRHAHILPVYAVGQGEGVAYMVMPLVRGESLRAFLEKSAPIEPAEAIRIVTDVARALAAAHRLGIVHRDVKPENILLEGDERNALLADFGIAKSADGPGGSITGTGVVLGSPHYMSPEQAAAEPELDGRSDVYSLGAVAYELLTGRRPYQAGNLQQLLVLQHTTDPAAVADVVPTVPRAVSDVVMRALARDVGQRWQSATEFAAALDALPDAAPRDPDATSWFARRGPILALAYVIGIYVSVMMTTVLTGRGPGVELAAKVIAMPLARLAGLVVVALFVELIVVVIRARRAGAAWSDVRRRAFGQPRWWQAWYPRSLRASDNIWERMPWSMRAMRTVVWTALVVVPVSMPLLFFTDDVAAFSSSFGVPLPLPLRIMIGASAALQKPLLAGLLVSVLAAFVLSRRRDVPFLDVVRLLFTWRESKWDSPTGRRLESAPLPRR